MFTYLSVMLRAVKVESARRKLDAARHALHEAARADDGTGASREQHAAALARFDTAVKTFAQSIAK